MKKYIRIISLILCLCVISFACVSCEDFNPLEIIFNSESFYNKIVSGDKIADNKQDLAEMLNIEPPEDYQETFVKYLYKITVTVTMQDGCDPHIIKCENGDVFYDDETREAIVTVSGAMDERDKSSDLLYDITTWARNEQVKNIEIEVMYELYA